MDLIDLSTLKGTTEDFEGFIDQLCRRLGVEYGSYATMNPVTGSVLGYATYKPAWKEHYTRAGMHRFDPTIHRSALSIAPVDWSRFERDSKFHGVFRSAHDFGISTQGITVPIRGPYGDRGLLSVTANMPDTEWRGLGRKIVGELQMAAVHLHDAVMRTGLVLPSLAHPILSAREREVLQWVAAGKSQQDVGDILSISSRTVEVHLRSAREKLGALTTVQAVGRAIGLGLIYPR
ncbi:MAG: LuxR family transcriptional regulator [Cereibacter sphaeroides]|uniref:LuxR family transcriptional regulator n=1 Tax=Cereibacter sphaeroides TaxID=1063 RepID=A0A2W5SCD3_CERSP|nr:MAG: LuxR family transcriptional regulator [Cereibacter sphaeroides]